MTVLAGAAGADGPAQPAGSARSLSTSPDGQWAAIRNGREVTVIATATAPVETPAPDAEGGSAGGTVRLDADDVDLALVGTPPALAVVVRDATPHVRLYAPPHFEQAARHELEYPATLAAVSGSSLALVSPNGKQVTLARAAGRAIATRAIDTGSPVEFAVGLPLHRFLFGLLRKFEVWDAASGRPVLRMQLQLPAAPRTVGTAHGHLWVTQPGSDEVYIYRLSDGRPFHHVVGSPVQQVIHHPGSHVIVLVTAKGLVRLHCTAHSLSVIDAPWSPGMPLALVAGGGSPEDASLIGLPDHDAAPWRVSLAGAGAPLTIDRDRAPRGIEPAPSSPEAPAPTAADKLRAMRERAEPVRPHAGARIAPASTWREPLAALGKALAAGDPITLPVVDDTPASGAELGELVERLGLGTAARRALAVLYGLYLAGESPTIANLARALGDWTEALGQGELVECALVRRRGGRVALRSAVGDFLDGAAPRAIRLVGGDATGHARSGMFRIARDGKSDVELAAALSASLGRIAIVEGAIHRAILEARLHDATAVAFHPPDRPPRPWPRDAGLVLVLPGSPSSWLADLPALQPG